MCLYPKLIHNPKYKETKKNGGKIPPIQDPRVLYIAIGCGHCIECTKRKARSWQIRLLEDIKNNKNAIFITLTFSDQSIYQLQQELPNIKGYTLDNAIATLATRRFLERWRKTYKNSLRHWLVTELGHNGTNNIHLHGLLWLPERQMILTEIDKHWQYGHTYKGAPIYQNQKITDYKNFVNETTIGYITKYVSKRDEKYKYYKSIILTSPGIGKNYTTNPLGNWIKNKFKEIDTDETYRTATGHKIILPTYFRNKIYNEQEREALWIQKLDKEERYVLGAKIDISQETETYLNVLQNAREKNIRLGYGSNQKDYDQVAYEQKMRAIMQHTRLILGKQKIIQSQLQKITNTPF